MANTILPILLESDENEDPNPDEKPYPTLTYGTF